ncbi:MAG: hypothetical protein WB760_01785 [Xanthobacteraceae bacterium]
MLRVLTDLYVQKLTHTPDEERHYTELALRLIESVDAPTRAAVAAQLMKHLSPPREVIQRLSNDVPEVCSALRSPPRPEVRSSAHSIAEAPLAQADRGARGREGSTVPTAPATKSPLATSPAGATAAVIGADVASELNEIFFAANASERRLILLNLDVVAPLTARRAHIARDPSIAQKLEVAALARRREDFVQHLVQSLLISREQARRIVDDELGEPITIAAKALTMPRDRLYRILLFINTAVGHSVERVHALALLYDEITLHVAQDVVAIWQALNAVQPSTGTDRPLLADNKSGARLAPRVQRTPALRWNERRSAS